MSYRPNDTEHLIANLNGTPVFLGTIVATTTKNNTDTATPFSNSGEYLTGKCLMIQSDTACYILPGTATTATVTTTNGVKLDAGEKFYIFLGNSYQVLAGLAVSGSSNIKVWELV